MAQKVKFNKTALKAQRDALRKYQKFLPILQLKKMQLQLVLRQIEAAVEAKRLVMASLSAGIRPWAMLLSDPTTGIEEQLRIREIQTDKDNIAGVEVPEFKTVVFDAREYSLFTTPAWFDPAVAALKEIVTVREELKVLRIKETLIREELQTTTQRVNLFEKKMIPELKEDIRRIKIFLGDEETAAVGRAKQAKAKLVKQAEA